MRAAGQVEVALVDGADFDVGSEIVGVGKHPAGEALVFLEVAGQHDELGAEPAGPDGGHGGVDAKLAGLVGGRGDDAALLAADGHRLAAQPRIGRLLDRGEKGIGIKMDNRDQESFSSFVLVLVLEKNKIEDEDEGRRTRTN